MTAEAWIIAILDQKGESWDPIELVTALQKRTEFTFSYKRIGDLHRAIDLVKADERLKDLRFIIVSRASLFSAIDPNGGSTMSIVPELRMLRDCGLFSAGPPKIIGVSANDMYATLLSRMGCDITCCQDNLVEQIALHSLSFPPD